MKNRSWEIEHIATLNKTGILTEEEAERYGKSKLLYCATLQKVMP